MQHQHIYDKEGKQLCCTQEEKINSIADEQLLNENKNIDHQGINETDEKHSEHDGHDHSNRQDSTSKMFLPAIISLVMSLLRSILKAKIKRGLPIRNA